MASRSFFSMRHKKEQQPTAPSPPNVDQYGSEAGEFQEQDHSILSVFGPFIKNLTTTKNPGKLPYPPQFYFPASSLQHQTALQMRHIDLLLSANLQASPIDRFLFVLKYSLSTCSLTKFPYKPFIAFPGETSHTYTVHSDEDNTSDMTFFMSEQLLRDPPASAFHISNPTRGVTHEGSLEMQPKFKQAHVQAKFVGQHKCTLADPQGRWKEEYFLDVPDLMIRLVRMFTELAGEVHVSCPTTGFQATITFKEKPLIGGGRNIIAGKIMDGAKNVIYTLDGSWDDVVYLHQAGSTQTFEFFNRKTMRKQHLFTPPISELPETSGDRVWGTFIDALKRQDFQTAMAIKDKLQITLDEQARIRGEAPFVPNYFVRSPQGVWTLKDPSLVSVQHN